MAERQNIEMKRDKPEFAMWYKVYGLGQMGSLAGAILQNWEYGAFDQSLPYAFGLDFGFNDPDAMVKVALDKQRKIIYIDEVLFKSGNSHEQLRQIIASHVRRNDLIVADCADARMIHELQRYFNIQPTNKKKWTIAEALKMMADYTLVITEGSANLAKELNNYIWHDKKSGVLVDDFNHLIDATRYIFQHFISVSNKRLVQPWHF
jgi:phage terminase large subunit